MFAASINQPQIIDASQRATALEPSQSFIVQAPAGSGKTELLTQRYLRLLALVEQPEEIVAITFTRKAAAEMRNRVLLALASAQQAKPDESHKQTTWQLAHAALQRDELLQWHIQLNPHRLRIQTFDSLAASLTRQLPILSELGAQPTVVENPQTLYRQAARATLADLSDETFTHHLAPVLRHLDNRLGQLEVLLCSMLQKRDQWLPHVLSVPNIDQLEAALGKHIEQQLSQLKQTIPDEMLTEWVRLACYAAGNLGADHALAVWRDRCLRPTTQWCDLMLWQGLAKLALTVNGTLRRTADKRLGFPAASEKGLDAEVKVMRKQSKDDLLSLLKDLQGLPDCIKLLAQVPGLPSAGYSAQQAELLGRLLQVLLRAAAHLQLVFQETGEVDFAEIQQRAIQALGDEEAPTDLALILDHRLKHLLVDEFQDTSSNQHQLLRLLTNGWQADDGRSLFVVGDPMQSIYRFREAEVGLYLQTRETGLADLPLVPLTLQMNFRSQAGVVDWINQSFQQLFPKQMDVARGAVSYAPSQAARTMADANVAWHPLVNADLAHEAEQISALIQAFQQQHTRNSIAILARSRSHLTAIASQLTVDGVDYQAIDIDPLSTRTVVQDLRSLTRALLHSADRLAWLSILRAPWLGLCLADLLAIAEGHAQPIFARLCDVKLRQMLSQDGQQRVERLLTILTPNLPYRGQMPLRTWVESIWINLGGLALADEQAKADAKAYFDLLSHLQDSAGLLDLSELDEQLQRLYAAPDSRADGQVQMMTMHAAKGLEFDVVILPGLGRKPRQNSSELLYWLEKPNSVGQPELLMAPIRANQEDQEPIADFIRTLNKDKDDLETVRLLYVAMTRARTELHLFGHCEFDKEGQPRPQAGSLLQKLWPIAAEQFVGLTPVESMQAIGALVDKSPEQRLAADWGFDFPGVSMLPSAEKPTSNKIDFAWAGDTARHVGTLVHRYLERIANEGVSDWSNERINALKPNIIASLAHLGVTPDMLEKAGEKTVRALHNTLGDEQGRWVLADHEQAACELALTVQDDKARHYIIDRTFIDEQGTRWIIDYKTSESVETDIDDFMNQEQARYREQLENYARIMGLLENKPVKLALYFPLLQDWRVWEYRIP